MSAECRAGRLVGVEGDTCDGHLEAVVVWDTFGRVAEACVLHGARLVKDLRGRGRPGVRVAEGMGGQPAVIAVRQLVEGGQRRG